MPPKCYRSFGCHSNMQINNNPKTHPLLTTRGINDMHVILVEPDFTHFSVQIRLRL